MADEQDPFPKWAEAARKADVLTAMVVTLTGLTKAAATIAALGRQDRVEFDKKYEELLDSLDDISSAIDGIGGAKGATADE